MLSNPSLLTIGLPFFNNEKTLHLAVKSVVNQTYTNFELYLIDDGSTDGSYEIARKIAQLDSRIKLIRDGQNKGLIYRLNQIIDLANGKYIARMDADDVMIPCKLQKQIIFLEENPAVDVVATAAYTIDENNKVIGIRDTHPIRIMSGKDVIKSSILIHPTILAKTTWYIKNRYDPAFYRAEDYELWCRAFKTTVFHRITEPLFFYREGNVSPKNYIASMRTLRKIFRIYGQYYLSFQEYYTEILKTYFKSAVYQVFGIFNFQHFLSARRNVRLSNKENIHANKVLSNLVSL